MNTTHQPSSLDSNIAGIFVTRTIGAWGIISGLLILVGGKKHWASHAYDTLNRLPGSPDTWGVIIALAGICVLVGSLSKITWGKYSLRNFGLWLSAAWCFLLVAGFVNAILMNPLSYNIPTTYFLIGVLCIFITKSRFEP